MEVITEIKLKSKIY